MGQKGSKLGKQLPKTPSGSIKPSLTHSRINDPKALDEYQKNPFGLDLKEKHKDDDLVDHFQKIDFKVNVQNMNHYKKDNTMLDIVKHRQQLTLNQDHFNQMSQKSRHESQKGAKLTLSAETLQEMLRLRHQNVNVWTISKLVQKFDLEHFDNPESTLESLLMYVNVPEIQNGQSVWIKDFESFRKQ